MKKFIVFLVLLFNLTVVYSQSFISDPFSNNPIEMYNTIDEPVQNVSLLSSGVCPYGCPPESNCGCWHNAGRIRKHVDGGGTCPHHRNDQKHTPIGDGIFVLLVLCIIYCLIKGIKYGRTYNTSGYPRIESN